MKNLFLPYFRTTETSSLDLNRNGHGLGLSICKKIMTTMGGTILVSSELGVGSNFTIRMATEIHDKDYPKKMVRKHLVDDFR